MMELGSKIKALRLRRGLTQEELGDRCDLTKGYISQLENDLTSPSIATLIDILDAVGSTLKQFFSSVEKERIVFTEEDFFEKEESGIKQEWVVPNSQKNMMEPLVVELSSGACTYKDMPHEGEEFGYVLSGTVTLVIDDEEYTVKNGESFYFESSKVHYICNNGKRIAKLIWVSTPPTF